MLDRALVFKPDSVDYRSLKLDALWSKTGDTDFMLATISKAQNIVGEEHYLHHKNKLLLDAGKLQESLEGINSIREEALLTQNRIIPMSLDRAYVHGQAGDTEKMI
ncbi:MAG TPA: hypothetical protein DGJ56_03890 [Verrucomicrobiales bacterium]|nr:hypothetical protein [Verrucomicrobiales bacterium]